MGPKNVQSASPSTTEEKTWSKVRKRRSCGLSRQDEQVVHINDQLHPGKENINQGLIFAKVVNVLTKQRWQPQIGTQYLKSLWRGIPLPNNNLSSSPSPSCCLPFAKKRPQYR